MKAFIGPQLRRLRAECGETRAQMGRSLGISTSCVNLLEKNERSVSVRVLLRLPDASQCFVFSRTVDRPVPTRHSQDMPQALAMGCSVEHASEIGYADELSIARLRAAEIGITCGVCPRQRCEQRAQHPILPTAPVDASRRGAAKFDG